MSQQDKIILAIETSCDETAVAILANGKDILANVLHSQVKIHRPYGGIVPELASRSHIEQIGSLLDLALSDADVNLDQIDAIAATRGPGLLGALLVGMNTAQAIAISKNLPFIATNHLHGHLVSSDLDKPMNFPALVLLVTGGHTALYFMPDDTKAIIVQRTVDDAVGEAFDKVAKLLGLSYPGGPIVEQQAKNGDPDSFKLPVPSPKNPNAISLSGLKTAVRREIEAATSLNESDYANICASFQSTVAKLLVRICETGLERFPTAKAAYLVGGVARNQTITTHLQSFFSNKNIELKWPAPVLCTDNAAMIARAAWTRWRQFNFAPTVDPFDLQPKNRWEFGTWPDQ